MRLEVLNLSPGPGFAGLYVHVPFCFHKCHYCDFYSIVDNKDRQGTFLERLRDEIRALGQRLETPLQTIFVGGGTPTLLAVDLWRQLASELRQSLLLAPDLEFTVEANPETVTRELAEALVDGGVNRVSLGAQSFNPRHLKSLERWHDPANVGKAVDILRRSGIPSINLDLIFAIPGQNGLEWEQDLHEAIGLEPDHLSCYGLTYEPNTPLTRKMKQGILIPIEEDLEADMYTQAKTMLAAHGYEHYEISAWSKPGHRCRHNLNYWTNGDWWALGPSAAGHINGVRWKNVTRLGEYLDSRGSSMVVEVEQLDADGRIGEALMLGLRLIDGIPRSRLHSLLAGGDRNEARKASIRRFIDDGLLEDRETALALSSKGLLLADLVLSELI